MDELVPLPSHPQLHAPSPTSPRRTRQWVIWSVKLLSSTIWSLIRRRSSIFHAKIQESRGREYVSLTQNIKSHLFWKNKWKISWSLPETVALPERNYFHAPKKVTLVNQKALVVAATLRSRLSNGLEWAKNGGQYLILFNDKNIICTPGFQPLAVRYKSHTWGVNKQTQNVCHSRCVVAMLQKIAHSALY